MKSPVLWLLGAISAASGVLLMASGGIGVEGGDIAEVISQLGNDGLDDISLRSRGMIALTLIFAGIGMLVTANAGAWRETGGY